MADACHFQAFDTSAASPHERFDLWRTRCQEVSDVAMRVDPADPAPQKVQRRFSASAQGLSAGDLIIAEAYCGPASGTWSTADTLVRDESA